MPKAKAAVKEQQKKMSEKEKAKKREQVSDDAWRGSFGWFGAKRHPAVQAAGRHPIRDQFF